MTEDVIIKFFTNPRKMESSLVKSVVDNCISNNSKYAEDLGYTILKNYKKRKGTLEEAIEKISKDAGGWLNFNHDTLYLYHISIEPQKIEKRKLGNIRLSTYGGNIANAERGPKTAEQLINIARSIWNALDEKSIYGYGDDWYSLPIEIGPHPNDDDIIALDVPINQFWLNFYGKDMIEKFGRKRLEEVKERCIGFWNKKPEKGAYRVEELDDGLLVVTDFMPKAYKRTYERKRKELENKTKQDKTK